MDLVLSAFAATGAWLGDATSQITSGLTDACSGGGGACNDKSTVASILGNLADVLIYLVGAIAVIMIIVGGLRYVTSNGDAKQAESARNTMLYAAIGVVLAMAAYAIVTFVLKIGVPPPKK